MPLFTRDALKGFFKKGNFPSEIHFTNLIESTVNKLDDGFAKSEDDGLQLAPQGQSDRLISFFKNINDANPEWQINFKEIDSRTGLSIETVDLDNEGKPQPHSWLFLHKDGKIGLDQTNPQHLLDVNGTAGLKTRVGTYLAAQVPGDGKWHPILTGLTGLNAFEIVARIDGLEKRGKYALTHAIALGTYGKSRSKIKQIRAWHGWFWNKISLRWKSSWEKTESGDSKWIYTLQIRTRSHYGFLPNSSEIVPIKFHITSLWDSTMDFPKLPPPPDKNKGPEGKGEGG